MALQHISQQGIVKVFQGMSRGYMLGEGGEREDEGTDCEDGKAHSTTKEERVTLIGK